MNENLENYPGWKGELTHLEAERLLRHTPPGTYVLRKGDPVTFCVQEGLSKENCRDVNCFILTIKEERNKIEDIMLVQMDEKWFIYHDDPDLMHAIDPKYDRLEDLLSTLKEKAKFPLKIEGNNG